MRIFRECHPIMMKKFIFLLLFSFSIYFISASLYQNKIHGFYFDFPETWEINKIPGSNAIVSFSNLEKSALFSIVIDKTPTNSNIKEYFDSFIKENNASGDGAAFIYNGKETIFSDLTFTINNLNFRGYFIFIKDNKKIYLLSAYSLESYYIINHDLLLSILDSFSKDNNEIFLPGPVSAFYYTKGETGNNKKTIKFEEKEIEFTVDEKDIDASEVKIEREARVLYSYSNAEDRITPWNRYYNLLFRDNYFRIKPIFEKIINETNLNLGTNEDKIRRIAKWIQNYTYERTGTISDITSPLKAILFSVGDCDSRTLLFLLIMDYLKIDSIMLLSPFYNHSAVGVALEKDGAKITYKNKKYLFIELTEEINIGLIQQKMSDASKWIPMKLGY